MRRCRGGRSATATHSADSSTTRAGAGLPGPAPGPGASFFFGARIWLGTILGRFSINCFSGLGLRIRVQGFGLGLGLGLGLGVILEGVGGYMPKRYEALRGGGGGVTSALRNVFFFLTNSAWFTVMSSRPTLISK